MASTSGRSGSISGAIRGRSGVDSESIRSRLGLDLGSTWGRLGSSGVDIGSDRLGVDLGSTRESIPGSRGVSIWVAGAESVDLGRLRVAPGWISGVGSGVDLGSGRLLRSTRGAPSWAAPRSTSSADLLEPTARGPPNCAPRAAPPRAARRRCTTPARRPAPWPRRHIAARSSSRRCARAPARVCVGLRCREAGTAPQQVAVGKRPSGR